MVGRTTDQRGNGAVAFILVLVIIGIVGFTGWYVWNGNKQNDAVLQQSEDVSESKLADSGKKAEPATDDSSVIELRKYSAVPAELQKAILDYTKGSAPDCVKDGKIVDIDGKATDQEVQYAASGSAITGVGCGGSAATLFVKRDAGHWEQIAGTQMAFGCDVLKANKVPAKLLTLRGSEAQCGDEASNSLIPYEG